MITNRANQINAIKALVKGQKVEEVLDIILAEVEDYKLETIIQTILDPTFKNKQEALTNPQRFVTEGKVTKKLNSELSEVNVPTINLSECLQKIKEE